MKASLKEDVSAVINMLEELINDTTIPRNIRKNIAEARDGIKQSKNERELEVNVTRAIYLLDDALNDINLPFDVRPNIMAVVSDLEMIKEKLK